MWRSKFWIWPVVPGCLQFVILMFKFFTCPKSMKLSCPFFCFFKKATCVRDLSSFTVFASDTILVVKCFIYICFSRLFCSKLERYVNETICCRFISPPKEGCVIFAGREVCPVDFGGTKILVCIFVLPKCDTFNPLATLLALDFRMLLGVYLHFFLLLIIHFDISL